MLGPACSVLVYLASLNNVTAAYTFHSCQCMDTLLALQPTLSHREIVAGCNHNRCICCCSLQIACACGPVTCSDSLQPLVFAIFAHALTLVQFCMIAAAAFAVVFQGHFALAADAVAVSVWTPIMTAAIAYAVATTMPCASACKICASLQALCMNDAVLGLGSLSRINERCLELKQGKPKRQAAEAAKQNRKVVPAGTQQPIELCVVIQSCVQMGAATMIALNVAGPVSTGQAEVSYNASGLEQKAKQSLGCTTDLRFCSDSAIVWPRKGSRQPPNCWVHPFCMASLHSIWYLYGSGTPPRLITASYYLLQPMILTQSGQQGFWWLAPGLQPQQPQE